MKIPEIGVGKWDLVAAHKRTESELNSNANRIHQPHSVEVFILSISQAQFSSNSQHRSIIFGNCVLVNLTVHTGQTKKEHHELISQVMERGRGILSN